MSAHLENSLLARKGKPPATGVDSHVPEGFCLPSVIPCPGLTPVEK